MRVIKCLENLLEIYSPCVAQPIIYGHIRHGKKKRLITMEQIVSERDPCPWLMCPTDPEGVCCHGFIAIDNVVFDSSSSKALVRCLETAEHICGGAKMDTHARHHKLPTPNVQLRKGHEQYRADSKIHELGKTEKEMLGDKNNEGKSVGMQGLKKRRRKRGGSKSGSKQKELVKRVCPGLQENWTGQMDRILVDHCSNLNFIWPSQIKDESFATCSSEL